MSAKAQRGRPNGDVITLKRYLWAVVVYNLGVVEDTKRPHMLRQKVGNALVQAAMAWMKATEITDVEARLQQLENAAERRNGHHDPY